MTSKEKLLYAVGLLMIAFGLFMTLGGIINIVEPDEMAPGSAVALTVIMGFVPTVVGWIICRRTKATARRRKGELDERSIMMLATQHNGRLTATELAMHTELSVAEAQQLLEQYTIKGITSIGISESGARVFHFHELISDDEKLGAEEL